MAFRKGKKKNPKTAITYFLPFHLFSTTASDYCRRTSPTAISSASSSGMFGSLLFFISLQALHLFPLHLIRLSTPPFCSSDCPETPPTTFCSSDNPEPHPLPDCPPSPSSPSLHLSLPSSHPTTPPLMLCFFFFKLKFWSWETYLLHLLLLLLSLISFYLSHVFFILTKIILYFRHQFFFLLSIMALELILIN